MAASGIRDVKLFLLSDPGGSSRVTQYGLVRALASPGVQKREAVADFKPWCVSYCGSMCGLVRVYGCSRGSKT